MRTPRLLVVLPIAALLAVAPALLEGCATNPFVPASAQVTVAQGVTTLDALYNTAAKVYLAQLPTMSAATKAQVKPLLVKAYKIVQAVDAAETLGTASTMGDQIRQATQLIGQAKALLGAK